MSENPSYHVNIPELLASLGICSHPVEIRPLTGGHLHRIYAVVLENGEKLVVKALNPGVMARPTAMRNFIVSEEIANLAAQVIPAVPARRFGENGRAVQEFGGQYYLLYDYVKGESLFFDHITSGTCQHMGCLLAKLHRLDVSSIDFPEEPAELPTVRDWTAYLSRDAVWYRDFMNHLGKLYEWDKRYCDAQASLVKTAVSHRDLEPKNVLWDGAAPYIIDWEAAGKADPWYDLFENAVYWSKKADGAVDSRRFCCFVSGYLQAQERKPDVDWNRIADAGFGLLDWLEYNLKRSLGIECADAEERRLGTEQAAETLKTLDGYDAALPELVKWVREEVGLIW